MQFAVQLHVNTLKQRLGQFIDAIAPLGRSLNEIGLIEYRLGPMHGNQRTSPRGSAQDLGGFRSLCRFGNQAIAESRVVVGAVQSLLKSPIPQQLRPTRFFHGLKLLQGCFYPSIGQQRADPVLFEPQQSLSELVGKLFGDKITTVFSQDLDHRSLTIPAQTTPNKFIDIIITPFGIREKADGRGLIIPENFGLAEWSRVDDLAPLGNAIGDIPFGDGVLTIGAVCDIGISANRIASGNCLTNFRK